VIDDLAPIMVPEGFGQGGVAEALDGEGEALPFLQRSQAVDGNCQQV
jgi:hypothetical protein